MTKATDLLPLFEQANLDGWWVIDRKVIRLKRGETHHGYATKHKFINDRGGVGPGKTQVRAIIFAEDEVAVTAASFEDARKAVRWMLDADQLPLEVSLITVEVIEPNGAIDRPARTYPLDLLLEESFVGTE